MSQPGSPGAWQIRLPGQRQQSPPSASAGRVPFLQEPELAGREGCSRPGTSHTATLLPGCMGARVPGSLRADAALLSARMGLPAASGRDASKLPLGVIAGTGLEGDLGSSDFKPLSPQRKQVPGEGKAWGQDEKPGRASCLVRGEETCQGRDLGRLKPGPCPAARSALSDRTNWGTNASHTCRSNFPVATLKK